MPQTTTPTKPKRVIDYRSPKTGRTHSFDWNKPDDPTDDDYAGLKNYVDSIESQEQSTPSANDKNIAAATTPKEDPDSNGWPDVLPNWTRRAGQKLVDVAKGVWESSPVGQREKSSAFESQLSKLSATDKQKAIDDQNDQLSKELKRVSRNPYDLATGVATGLDPTGVVPGYMGLGKMGYQDIKNKDWPGLGVDVGLAVAPWLVNKGLKGFGKGGVNPEVLPPEPARLTETAGMPPDYNSIRVERVPPRVPKQLTEIAGVDPRVPSSAGNPNLAVNQRGQKLIGAFNQPEATPPGTSRFESHPTGKVGDVFDINTPETLAALNPETRMVKWTGNPSKANALPPIDQLPKVDTSIVPQTRPIIPNVTEPKPVSGTIVGSRPLPPVTQPSLSPAPFIAGRAAASRPFAEPPVKQNVSLPEPPTGGPLATINQPQLPDVQAPTGVALPPAGRPNISIRVPPTPKSNDLRYTPEQANALDTNVVPATFGQKEDEDTPPVVSQGVATFPAGGKTPTFQSTLAGMIKEQLAQPETEESNRTIDSLVQRAEDTINSHTTPEAARTDAMEFRALAEKAANPSEEEHFGYLADVALEKAVELTKAKKAEDEAFGFGKITPLKDIKSRTVDETGTPVETDKEKYARLAEKARDILRSQGRLPPKKETVDLSVVPKEDMRNLPDVTQPSSMAQPKEETTVEKAKDFSTSGNYHVKLPSGSKVAIFQDPSTKEWMVDTTAYGKRPPASLDDISTKTQEEAVAKLEKMDARGAFKDKGKNKDRPQEMSVGKRPDSSFVMGVIRGNGSIETKSVPANEYGVKYRHEPVFGPASGPQRFRYDDTNGIVKWTSEPSLDDSIEVENYLSNRGYNVKGHDPSPSDRPQEMRVREGGYSGNSKGVVGPVTVNPNTGRPNLAMGGADPQVLRQLGTSLYTKDRPSVLIQELMQNTLDEMKIAGVQKPVRVGFTDDTTHPTTGDRSRSIVFQDFGRGMNEDQLYNEFSDVGKSGKRQIQGAAGGFGFAKAAPFLGGDYMRTESVTIENGKKVKYTFGGKPEEFLDQELGVPLNREVVSDSTPTGMRVEVFYPNDRWFGNAKKLLQTITESSPDVKDIETLSRNYDSDTTRPGSVIGQFTKEGAANLPDEAKRQVVVHKGKPLPSYKDTVTDPANDADVYYDLDNKERRGTDLIFLNNGVFYHSESQGASIHAIPHVPERIVINIKSKVQEGHDKYPFPANRQGLNDEVKAGYRDWVEENVIKPARDKYENELQHLYDRTKPKPGMSHVVIDSEEKYTPEELARVENSPALGRVANVMGSLLQDLESHFSPEELVGKTEKYGFRIADPGQGGMNISDPSTDSPDLKTLVVSNIFDGFHSGFAKKSWPYTYEAKELKPAEASRRIVHVIKHEFAHNLARSEGGDYTWAFSQVDTRFPRTAHYEAEVLKAITDKSGNYVREIPELLQEYIAARQRRGTKEDVLSRQAASIEYAGKGKSEGVSGSAKPDGDGAIGEPGIKPEWYGKPAKTVRLTKEGKGRKVKYPPLTVQEPDLPSAAPKGPIKRFREGALVVPEGVESIESKAEKKVKAAEKLKYADVDPNKIDVVYPERHSKSGAKGRLAYVPASEEPKTKGFQSGKEALEPPYDVVPQTREDLPDPKNIDKITMKDPTPEQIQKKEAEGYKVTRRSKNGEVGMYRPSGEGPSGPDESALKAGEAKPTSFKDPSGLKVNYASPHTTLLNNPLTEPLARPIIEAFDKKQQWIRATLDKAAPHIKGLSKADRKTLGVALDTGDFSNLSPDMKAKARGLKQVFEDVHKRFPAGKDVGYITDYFTHMADQPAESLFAAAKNLVQDKEVKVPKESPDTLGDMYEKGLGKPDSPYIKKRTGALKDINYDVKDVLPKYLESVAKVIFDEPAVDNAKIVLKTIPDSNLKELASWYVKNYTRYDAEAGLHRAFNTFASKLANATARSFIDWNPGLHMLHAGEIPVNIWPELGTKYTAYGIKQVVTNPIKTWKETAKLGLIQGENKPFAFKTAGERWQTLAYFFNSVEKFVKGTGYAGAKKKFLDQGLSEEAASQKALELTKDMTLDTSPPRQMKGLSNESNTVSGEIGSKLGGQFKGVPAKIAEQMARIASNAKKNPKAALRLAAGAAAMIYATNKGAHTFHLNPASLIKTTAFGAFGTAVEGVASALYRGDYETAIEKATAWAVPGGQTASDIYDYATDKGKRDVEKQNKTEKETKAGNPPLNTPRRVFDYLTGNEKPRSKSMY